ELPVAEQRPELLTGPFAPLPDLLVLVLLGRGRLLIKRPHFGLAAGPDDEGAHGRPRVRRLTRAGRTLGGGLGDRREEEVEEPLLDALLGDLLDRSLPFLTDQIDGHVDEVADHRVDIPADVSDLGELRGLDLDE